MKNLNSVAEDLFNKIRGRFPSVTIGDEQGTVTTVPEESRFYDFAFKTEGAEAGKVSISLDEENGITVIVGKDIVENQPQSVKSKWFDFLRELRQFAKKRMLQFDVRDINKSNLQKRDYKHLAATRPGESTMAESKMYGTNRTSYQRIGGARLAIKHLAPINTESTTGRTQKIGSIFIESPDGERFRYPYRHLSGARAMARHVAEGGTAYDEFGQYISSLSEELSKLRKFNTYMNRSGVMAETLGEYTDIVKERSTAIRKEIQNLQKENYYREAREGFTAPIVEEVPEDVAENWIDQLTIRQFNEELKDVFPYIYRLVGEATKAKELGPEDLDEAFGDHEETDLSQVTPFKDKKTGQTFWHARNKEGTQQIFNNEDEAVEFSMSGDADIAAQDRRIFGYESVKEDPCWKGYKMVGHKKKGGREVPNCVPEEIELEAAFESMMGQFGEADLDQDAGTKQGTLATLKGLKVWEVNIGNNYGGGKYADWGFRPYPVLATSAEEAKQVVLDNADAILKDLLSKKLHNGKRLLPPRSALPVVDKHIGRVEDGTVKGRRSTFDFNTYFSPQGPMNVKLKDGNIVDVQGKTLSKEKDVEEGPFKGLGKMMMKRKLKKDMSKHDDDLDDILDIGGTDDEFAKAYDQKARKKKALSRLSRESEPLQPEKPKTPLGEFILSYFDRETGKFPKGETAVLTAVEKDYGDEYVEPARQFIEKIESTTLEYLQREESQSRYPETEMIKRLAGM